MDLQDGLAVPRDLGGVGQLVLDAAVHEEGLAVVLARLAGLEAARLRRGRGRRGLQDVASVAAAADAAAAAVVVAVGDAASLGPGLVLRRHLLVLDPGAGV